VDQSPHEIIRSSHNSLIKRIRSLGLRKYREAERAFVIDGRRIVETALQRGAAIEMIVVASDADPSLTSLAIESGADWRIVDRPLFDAVMETTTPQGIAAIARIADTAFPETAEPFVVVLDGINDPGNVGTIIRTAAAAGADAVVVGPGSADPYGAKAARATMGAIFSIPVLTASAGVDDRLRSACRRRWLADGDGEAAYSDLVWNGGVAVIIGSEARGATEWGLGLATGRVRIPIEASVESLNASIAAGIIIFEARRQRPAS
jgi:TrmH family RNA methyltransferase